MSGSAASLSQAFRQFWSVLTGKKLVGSETRALSDVVLHDPAAQRPHDLDDPFVDPKVQTRIGDAIANAATRK
jgi:hypothetical protein